MKKSRVFVDGALIGLDDDAKALVASIRSMRRQGAHLSRGERIPQGV